MNSKNGLGGRDQVNSEDGLGGRDRVNSEDGLGGRDRSSLEMHSEAVTERVWRCTCRL